MPLLKLWNALRGRSNGEPSSARESNREQERAGRPSKSIGSGFQLFGGGPHGALCKRIAKSNARSVLEIAVGDGTRAVAISECLAKKGGEVRYFGIDEFEASDGSVSLKDFHRTLRAAGVRAQIFPEPTSRALIRFLHTVGTVDLIVVSDSSAVLDDPEVRNLLDRIAHVGTLVLYQEDDNWKELETAPTRISRAA